MFISSQTIDEKAQGPSLLGELLLSTAMTYNNNELQIAAYRDYLVKNVKTTRNDKARSATARYNLVKKCELNALACLPQYVVDNEIFDTLNTETLILLGEKDIFSTNVTNKLDFLNADFKGDWHHLLIKTIVKHECLFEKLIKKFIDISNCTTLDDTQKYCAIDALLFFILFMIRFHGIPFRDVYREGFKLITRQCPDLSSYQLYNLSSFGAFVHYDDDILKRFKDDHYNTYRNYQYLVYAHKKTKKLFRNNQGLHQDERLIAMVKQHTKEDDIISLGEYGLKCLRFPTYFTFPLTKIALSWIRFTLANCSLAPSKKYTIFMKKVTHILKLEKNRLAQDTEIKRDYQDVLNMLSKLTALAELQPTQPVN